MKNTITNHHKKPKTKNRKTNTQYIEFGSLVIGLGAESLFFCKGDFDR
jgi:hypothetical protein